MNNLLMRAVFVPLSLMLVTGCVTNGLTRPEAVATITGHEVIGVVEEEPGLSKVEFFPAGGIPGRLLAVVPDVVLEGEVPVASIFWHGDDEPGRRRRDPVGSLYKRVYRLAEKIERTTRPIAVYRPYSHQGYHLRSMAEMRLNLALVEYIHQTFAVEKFNFHGHSGGGTVAIAMATERPYLTATVGLAAPVLAAKKRYRHRDGGIPPKAYRQYDPIDHIGKLQPGIPVLVAYDLRDKIVRPPGVLPYIERAKELGLNVTLAVVREKKSPYHFPRVSLGKLLLEEEYREFRPQR